MGLRLLYRTEDSVRGINYLGNSGSIVRWQNHGLRTDV